MVCPFAKVNVTVQLEIAVAPAVTTTSPWNAPGHWLTIRYVAEHVPVGGAVDVVEDGGRLVVLEVTGGRLDVVVGGELGEPTGGNRRMRSSVATGVPRPSRLLVAYALRLPLIYGLSSNIPESNTAKPGRPNWP